MKTYSSRRSGIGGQTVMVTEAGSTRTLQPRLDLWNHSPDGFNWGYGGSGPAQLALALLADALGDDRRAVDLHQPFKWQFVATFGDEWSMTKEEIVAWANAKRGIG